MRVLIIGGAGYLGLQLTKEFLRVETPVVSVDTMNYTDYNSILNKSKYKP